MTLKKAPSRAGREGRQRRKLEALELYSMLLPAFLFLLLFDYKPIYGILIAFQDYMPGMGILSPEVQWVGLKYFRQFVQGQYFIRLLGNTIRLSVTQLVFGFFPPVILALALNSLRAKRFRNFVQTASYMPYFISSVVVAGMVLSFIDADGVITRAAQGLGMKTRDLSLEPAAFTPVYVLTNIWKSFGFSSILYLSTLSSVDMEQYEAARIDGASAFGQMIHISIPSIQPVIAIQLILAVGGIMSTNSELILLLYNSAVYKTADVFGTYVYRYGLLGGKYSFTTAVGLFTQLINFALVFLANKISSRVLNFALW